MIEIPQHILNFGCRIEQETGVIAAQMVMADPHTPKLTLGLVPTMWVSELTPSKAPDLKPSGYSILGARVI